jgi:hypothetical protein
LVSAVHSAGSIVIGMTEIAGQCGLKPRAAKYHKASGHLDWLGWNGFNYFAVVGSCWAYASSNSAHNTDVWTQNGRLGGRPLKTDASPGSSPQAVILTTFVGTASPSR